MNLLPVNKTSEIVAVYIDQELVPKASGFQTIGILIIGTALAKKFPDVLTQYGETLRMLGLMVGEEPDAYIDLESVYVLAKNAFERTGKVSAAGILFSADDIDKLYSIARKYTEEVSIESSTENSTTNAA